MPDPGSPARLAPWRIGRGWSEPERQAHLRALARRPAQAAPDFAAPPNLAARAVHHRPGWTTDGLGAALAQEPPGPPLTDGPFARARRAVLAHRFADPRITAPRFDPAAPLLGRDVSLEARAPLLRFLIGVRIGATVERTDATRTVFGVRYDALAGHPLAGSEWVALVKDHASGAVRAEITARWHPSRVQAWWVRLGFRLFGQQLRRRWQRQAIRRLRILAVSPA